MTRRSTRQALKWELCKDDDGMSWADIENTIAEERAEERENEDTKTGDD